MPITVRGIEFQENTSNDMGLEFYNLSHRYGFQCPNWPYFRTCRSSGSTTWPKSGVLSQTITTTMHVTTHIDAPAHVVQGTPFIDEVPLPHFFGSGLVVSIPKKKWEQITADDLGKGLRPRDPQERCSDHQHRLAQAVRRRRLLRLLSRACAVGRRLDGRKGDQGGWP